MTTLRAARITCVEHLVRLSLAALCVVGTHPAPALAQTSAGPSSSISTAVPDSGVVLAPGDIVRIAVWRNTELSGEFTVAPDGSITHPLYREVKVAGIPLPEVERRIGAFLSRYGEANAAFAVTTLIRVFVGGEVRAPNVYTVPPGSTVAQALAAAGGPGERARLNEVQILRNSHRFTLDLTSADPRVMQAQVRSGDQLFVPRMHSVFAEYIVPASSLLAAAAAITSIIVQLRHQ